MAELLQCKIEISDLINLCIYVQDAQFFFFLGIILLCTFSSLKLAWLLWAAETESEQLAHIKNK